MVLACIHTAACTVRAHHTHSLIHTYIYVYRYLIQPSSSAAAAASKGQTTSWDKFARAAATMPTQLLFLWVVLCWGTGSRIILYYRYVS